MEAALASAAKKRYPEQDVLVRVAIDPKDGEYETFRRWEVVADDVVMESPDRQMRLMDAVDESAGAEVGDYIEEPIENPEFGRIAAQAAKQVIVQRVREAERAQVVDAVEGSRRRTRHRHRQARRARQHLRRPRRQRRGVHPASDKGDPARVGARRRSRARLSATKCAPSRAARSCSSSRAAPEFMIELFKLEVPEVGQGLVEIKACARDPGDRAKIAVLAHDNRTDPIGACIGMRGSRVQAVSNELNGERIDIVLWNDNPAQFVINAMAPAEVQSIIVDEEKHSMDIAVAEDKLVAGDRSRRPERAPGQQAVRLAAQRDDRRTRSPEERSRAGGRAPAVHGEARGRQRDRAASWCRKASRRSRKSPTCRPPSCSASKASTRTSSRSCARVRAMRCSPMRCRSRRKSRTTSRPRICSRIEGMDEGIAFELAQHGVITRENLADLATDELMEFGIEGIDEEKAAALIMAAREAVFS